MKTYKVTLSGDALVSATVSITAKSPEDAQRLALAMKEDDLTWEFGMLHKPRQRIDMYYQTRAIGTVEGSVFIVRYHVGSWQYSIVGPGRTYGGSCQGPQTFDETLASAKKHIEQAFGGVLWECSL